MGPLLILFSNPPPTPLLTRPLKNYFYRHFGVSEKVAKISRKIAKNESKPICCLFGGYFVRASTCRACPMFASYNPKRCDCHPECTRIAHCRSLAIFHCSRGMTRNFPNGDNFPLFSSQREAPITSAFRWQIEHLVGGPRIGCWIRRPWICVLGEPQIAPKPFKTRVWGLWTESWGAPKS